MLRDSVLRKDSKKVGGLGMTSCELLVFLHNVGTIVHNCIILCMFSL
jgi:hypothetical protein